MRARLLRLALSLVLAAITLTTSESIAAPPMGDLHAQLRSIKQRVDTPGRETEAMIDLYQLLVRTSKLSGSALSEIEAIAGGYYARIDLGKEEETKRFQDTLLQLFRLTGGDHDGVGAAFKAQPKGGRLSKDVLAAQDRWRTPTTCEIRLAEPVLACNGQWVPFTARAKNEIGFVMTNPGLTFRSSDTRIVDVLSDSRTVRAAGLNGRASVQAIFRGGTIGEQAIDVPCATGQLVRRVVAFGAAPVESTVAIPGTVDGTSLTAKAGPDSIVNVETRLIDSGHAMIMLRALRPGEARVTLSDRHDKRTGEPFWVIVPPELNVQITPPGKITALARSKDRFLRVAAGDSMTRLGLQLQWSNQKVAKIGRVRPLSATSMEYEIVGTHEGTSKLQMRDPTGHFRKDVVVNVDPPSAKYPLVGAVSTATLVALALKESSAGSSKHDEAVKAANSGDPGLDELNSEADSHYKKATVFGIAGGVVALADIYLWRRYFGARGKLSEAGGRASIPSSPSIEVLAGSPSLTRLGVTCRF